MFAEPVMLNDSNIIKPHFYSAALYHTAQGANRIIKLAAQIMMSKTGQTNNLLDLKLKLEWYQSCKQPEAAMREMRQYLTEPQA